MNKNSKILFFSFEILKLLRNDKKPAGGVSTELISWMAGFVDNESEIGLLTMKGANGHINSNYKFKIIETYDPNKGIPKIRMLYKQIPALYFGIKKFNPKFVFQEGANLQTFMIAISTKLAGKIFIHRLAHDWDVDDRVYNLISKFEAFLYRIGRRMADHISCQNEYQCNAIKKLYPTKSASVENNPFEVKSKYQSLERSYIAWIGNFRHAKNLPALAKTAENLPQYQFKIAGGNFEKTDADAEAGLKILKKLENVEFVGYIDNDKIRDFLNHAYVLLNTARAEGFSNTFLEAWSAGTPVISTQNVNPDNLIPNFQLGAIADSYDSLPSLIEEFISAKKYEEFSENCYNYVVEKHNPQKLAKELLEKLNL